MLKALFGSKKFMAAAIGVVAVLVHGLLQQFGVKSVSDEAVLQAVGLIASYVVGQGLADFGKSAAASKDVK